MRKDHRGAMRFYDDDAREQQKQRETKKLLVNCKLINKVTTFFVIFLFG